MTQPPPPAAASDATNPAAEPGPGVAADVSLTSEAPVERPWSLALSGGGHRASLFAAGVLLYLADAGVSAQVSSIASVSGGSITNGVLAHADRDFTALNGDALRRLFADLMHHCARTGTVQWAWEAKAIIMAAVVSVAVSVFGMVWCGEGWWGGSGYALVPLVLGLLAAIGCYESISRIADRILNRQFFSSTRLRDVKRSVTHVFCTTELQTKLHLHLSQHFVYNGGFGDPAPTGRVRLSSAVQASACFPPVFPTRKIRAKTIGLPTRLARRTWLADGGVYDNMGDQWARGLHDDAVTGSDAERRKFAIMGAVPTRLLVINSSGGGSPHRALPINRIPLLGDLYALKAESDVMYKETTATRRADMWAQFDLARQLADQHDPLADKQIQGSLLHIATPATWPIRPHARKPAGVNPACWETARTELQALSDDERQAIEAAAHTAAGVRTTLAAVGSDNAISLLWHGYALAMVNFVIFEGQPWHWQPRAAFAGIVSPR